MAQDHSDRADIVQESTPLLNREPEQTTDAVPPVIQVTVSSGSSDVASNAAARQNSPVEENKTPEPAAHVPSTVHSEPVAGIPADPMYHQHEALGLPVHPQRQPWSTGLFDFFFSGDEYFHGSDCEICVVGSVAPCVLVGTTMNRLRPEHGTFVNTCTAYAGLCIAGMTIFSSNWMAPLSTFPMRTAIRRSFNLQGTAETMVNDLGCGGSFLDSDAKREQCELITDFVVHFGCHPCALCQEAREVRRRIPVPGVVAVPVGAMVVPPLQVMVAREAV
eukprot:TRINITY_DN18012_c0_g1_i1.p1 TRINITY_DN18012_c0_g1~~TRINITY_DN18012_c0_g1_i1.p1  ORF type:complete len:276 (+),score=36.15 TRINITY_DN18012_c0_g1_i1:140-967(+)